MDGIGRRALPSSSIPCRLIGRRMRIHQVRIERFRGIKLLDWKPQGAMVCLLGPGDSGKTTILDAIEAALSSRWSLSLTDDDFFGGDTSQSIRVSVT